MEDIKVTKITDKIENLDIQGQGCDDDCVSWSGISQTYVDQGVGENCVKSTSSSWWPFW